MTFLERSERARNEKIDTDSENVSAIMRGYKYPIAPWPIIISKGAVKEYTEVVQKLPEIFYAALDNYFGDNTHTAAEYFGISEYSYELFRNLNIPADGFMIRHDFVYHNDVIKLIETNVGSTIGGWQHDWFIDSVLKQFDKYEQISSLNLTRPNTFRAFFEALVYQVLKTKPDRSEITIVIPCLAGLGREETIEAVSEFCAFDKEPAFKNFHVNFDVIHETNEIQFNRDNYVFVNGKEVDALLFTISSGFSSQLSTQIYNATADNKLVFMDGLCRSVFGNKAMYALLHEPIVLNALSEYERDFIKKYVPWTFRLTHDDITHKSQVWARTEILKQNKNKFLIKNVHSSQGEDIFIGEQVDQAQWDAAVDSAAEEASWIAQQYCTPDTIESCNTQGELKRFDMVWGIFDLAGSYQGAFVRGSEVADSLGVINSSKGALEFFVFEEEEKLERISL
ncbi:hypothetical protein [Pseudoalteromonas umbrosa]|uniref:hypothetical protein n=1 Tax=Pseudoalteromonas umbrosa TaxID=3048489 RepID=UPI0024C21FDB|nr:hypothetical protein [Pseudoalteromonas sp. B95]MDK1288852.1 hypothetical protein [Pseudoalteromonas sp. B95]